MKLRTKDLTQTKQWMSDSEREAIAEIIQVSFSNVSPEAYLQKYFTGADAFQRKLRLYFNGDKLVGYCLLTFSNEVGAIVIRASAGFYPEFRKGGNTFKFSLLESLKCWLFHPWRKIYYADTMLSPAMYRAIAKNTGIVWPHPHHSESNKLFERFNSSGEVSPEAGLRCLVPTGRISNYSESELAEFKESNKLEIQYYCRVNPNFNKGIAMFVIIPVNIKQFVATVFKKIFKKL
ncbi:hypothetical protein [Pleionea sediminis]|uniref:hypothetical protein n=1 Tax=Pleionea sediminis TaxID=2569479 RepID=UPI0011849A3F|nr:hypothetical protein [Pleionea sediminis]